MITWKYEEVYFMTSQSKTYNLCFVDYLTGTMLLCNNHDVETVFSFLIFLINNDTLKIFYGLATCLGCTPPLANFSWDRLQQLCYPKRDSVGWENGWMDLFCHEVKIGVFPDCYYWLWFGASGQYSPITREL